MQTSTKIAVGVAAAVAGYYVWKKIQTKPTTIVVQAPAAAQPEALSIADQAKLALIEEAKKRAQQLLNA